MAITNSLYRVLKNSTAPQNQEKVSRAACALHLCYSYAVLVLGSHITIPVSCLKQLAVSNSGLH